jgi:transposase
MTQRKNVQSARRAAKKAEGNQKSKAKRKARKAQQQREQAQEKQQRKEELQQMARRAREKIAQAEPDDNEKVTSEERQSRQDLAQQFQERQQQTQEWLDQQQETNTPQVIPPHLDYLHLHAAGIDVHSGEHWVAVPEGSCPAGDEVKTFAANTRDLKQLVKWLKQCGVNTVAMESTHIYWEVLYDMLEKAGLEVYLVNPRHLKHVTGRKTDAVDCQWLQILHTFGLLSPAFVPRDEVRQLRVYLRSRVETIEEMTRSVQHMQKALDRMNLKLRKVITDIMGVTGQKIIRSILAGERDPAVLATHRDPNCKRSEEEIALALEGTYKPEQLFLLQQALERYEFCQQQITALDEKIGSYVEQLPGELPADEIPDECQGSRKNNAPKVFDPRREVYRLTGVDLGAIDGLDGYSALKLISETGWDMDCWPTVGHFTSWLGLSPNPRVSGGKRKSSHTRSTANRAATILRMAANALHRNNSALGAFFRRMKARLGSPKAITAAAHKIARIVYSMLKNKTQYQAMDAAQYEQQFQARQERELRRRARKLGFRVERIEPMTVVDGKMVSGSEAMAET